MDFLRRITGTQPVRATAPLNLPPAIAPIAPAGPAELRPRDTVRRTAQLDPTGPVAGIFAAQEGYANEIGKLQAVTVRTDELPDFSVRPLRIGIAVAQRQAEMTFSGSLKAETPQGTVDLGSWENADIQVSATEGGFTLRIDGQPLGTFQGRLIGASSAETVKINGRAYRGGIEVTPHPTQPNTLNVLNPVMLEDYLLSVVPSESPASWPLESLKAQAMAARTYAVANWQKRAAQGYDMNADTSDQMYRGLETEMPSTNQAVKETANQILTYGGKPINALFFSSSGGYTDSSKEVWGTELPYIQPVPDFDQASPRYRWEKTISQNDLQTALRNLGHNIGTIREVRPLTFTPQKRVKTLELVGTQGRVTVDSNKFRFAAKLNSTLWTVSRQNGNPPSFRFDGGGWGHGLGMSQWGARQMAADGKSAEEIVKHYYTGIAIEALP